MVGKSGTAAARIREVRATFEFNPMAEPFFPPGFVTTGKPLSAPNKPSLAASELFQAPNPRALDCMSELRFQPSQMKERKVPKKTRELSLLEHEARERDHHARECEDVYNVMRELHVANDLPQKAKKKKKEAKRKKKKARKAGKHFRTTPPAPKKAKSASGDEGVSAFSILFALIAMLLKSITQRTRKPKKRTRKPARASLFCSLLVLSVQKNLAVASSAAQSKVDESLMFSQQTEADTLQQEIAGLEAEARRLEALVAEAETPEQTLQRLEEAVSRLEESQDGRRLRGWGPFAGFTTWSHRTVDNGVTCKWHNLGMKQSTSICCWSSNFGTGGYAWVSMHFAQHYQSEYNTMQCGCVRTQSEWWPCPVTQTSANDAHDYCSGRGRWRAADADADVDLCAWCTPKWGTYGDKLYCPVDTTGAAGSS